MDDTYTSPLSPTAGDMDRKEEDVSNVLSQRIVTPDMEVSRTYRVACFVLVAHHSLNIFSEILFYRLSLYISRLQMYSFGLNIHEISRF